LLVYGDIIKSMGSHDSSYKLLFSHSEMVLMLSLCYKYSGVYLQSLWTDGMGMVEIRRKGIYLDKTTKPCKETGQMV